MIVYILDIPNRSLKQMLEWLTEKGDRSEVIVFTDYRQILERIEKFPPDFCLIRLGEDSIPGFKTAGMIQSINQEIKIIFISDEPDYILEAYRIGAHGYILCPVQKEQFRKMIFAEAG